MCYIADLDKYIERSLCEHSDDTDTEKVNCTKRTT